MAGGFFASGFKRAFKIKDFGDSIPGHGGLTDRMDCQVVMAVFANIYYNTFVKLPVATVASLLQTVRRSLTLGAWHVDQPYLHLPLQNLQRTLSKPLPSETHISITLRLFSAPSVGNHGVHETCRVPTIVLSPSAFPVGAKAHCVSTVGVSSLTGRGGGDDGRR